VTVNTDVSSEPKSRPILWWIIGSIIFMAVIAGLAVGLFAYAMDDKVRMGRISGLSGGYQAVVQRAVFIDPEQRSEQPHVPNAYRDEYRQNLCAPHMLVEAKEMAASQFSTPCVIVRRMGRPYDATETGDRVCKGAADPCIRLEINPETYADLHIRERVLSALSRPCDFLASQEAISTFQDHVKSRKNRKEKLTRLEDRFNLSDALRQQNAYGDFDCDGSKKRARAVALYNGVQWDLLQFGLASPPR